MKKKASSLSTDRVPKDGSESAAHRAAIELDKNLRPELYRQPSTSSVAEGANSPCALCGGPHDFDTSVPSAVWNRVIRPQGLPEHLCTTCIVREFVRAGEGFTAQLYSEEFSGVPIEVIVNGKNANDVALVSHEHTAYRVRIEELETALKISALMVHSIGGYHHPSWITLEQCKRSACVESCALLAAKPDTKSSEASYDNNVAVEE